MERKKFYWVIIIVLLLSNTVCIFFLLNPKHNIFEKVEGPRNIIIEKLEFNDNQVQAYDSLIQWHRRSIRNNEKKLFQLKSELYSSIESNNIHVDSIIKEINTIQFEIEKIHIQHFRDIEALCDSSQKDNFKSLSLELSSLFKPRKP